MQAVSDTVNIVEVGPRDGLQFEPNILPTNDKVVLIEKLIEAGLDQIEVGAFLPPGKSPQLADTAHLFTKLNKKRAFTYSALVHDKQTMQHALAADAKTIAVNVAASETFTQKHIGCSIKESFERLKPVIEIAQENDIEVRGYLSCIFGCPYEGQIKLTDTVRVAEQLYKAGCHEISLADTVGVGTPNQAQTLILHVGGVVPLDKISVHFYNTRGQAMANILASLEMGISTIDSSVAGLGRCPYTQGVSGNVSTEDVVFMLHGLGIESGVDLEKIIDVGRWVSEKLNRTNNSRVGLAGIPNWIKDS